MINRESHIMFKTIMDKNSISVAFGGTPAFLPEEIDQFINQGLFEIVFNKFTGTNPSNIAFEGSVKRVADLQKLVKTDYKYAVDIATDKANNCLKLNGDFDIKPVEALGGNPDARKRMLFVSSILNVTTDGTSYTKIPCQIIDHENLPKFMEAYNNMPWVPIPVVSLENNILWICYDRSYVPTGSTVSIDLTYVDTPPTITYTLPDQEIVDIPDNVMVEAINRAVVIALENTESLRTQSKLQLNTIQE